MSRLHQTPSPLDDELKKLLAPGNRLQEIYTTYLQPRLKWLNLVVLAIILGTLGYLFSKGAKVNETSQIEHVKKQWKQTTYDRSSQLDLLDHHFRKYPSELGSFKGTFLQTALLAGKQEIVSRWLDRPSNLGFTDSANSPLAAYFNQMIQRHQQISRQVSDKMWQEALVSCNDYLQIYRAPKIDLDPKQAAFVKLCTFHVLTQRGFVFQNLNDALEELKAWKELLVFVGISESVEPQAQSNSDLSLADKFFKSYGQENASLLDYIRYRMEQLSAKS